MHGSALSQKPHLGTHHVANCRQNAEMKNHLKLLQTCQYTGLYSFWIFYAYGSYQEFYDFYMILSAKYTQAGNFYVTIQKNQYFLIPISIITIFIGFLKYRLSYLTNIVTFSIISIISFYFLVQDPGPYSVFILPSYYLLIFTLADFELKTQKFKTASNSS